MATEMTDTTLLPDPDNPNCPVVLPAPCGFDTELKTPSPTPTMDIDDTPIKATFYTNNHGLQLENTNVQLMQHVDHNLHVPRTKNPRPLQGSAHTKTIESDTPTTKATFTTNNHGLQLENSKV